MTREEIQKEYNKNERKYGRKANIALSIGLSSIIAAPILLTQFSYRFDFTNSGQIGDTIGGTTTPFLSLIGAVLVYYSFKQQMIANRIQINALNEEKDDKRDMQIVTFCDKLQGEIKELINNQTVMSPDAPILPNDSENYIKKGTEAISSILYYFERLPTEAVVKADFQPCLDSINIIFRNVKLLLNYIDKVRDTDLKEMLFNNYYNNLHLILFTGNTDRYRLKAGYTRREKILYQLSQDITDLFNKLEEEFNVENKFVKSL